MPSRTTNKFMRKPLAEGRTERAPGCCHYCGKKKHRGSIFKLWKCNECGAVLCSNQKEEDDITGDPCHSRWSHGAEHVEDIDGSFYEQTYFKPVSCGPLAEVDFDDGVFVIDDEYGEGDEDEGPDDGES